MTNTSPAADQLLAVLAYHVLETAYGSPADLLAGAPVTSLLADVVGTGNASTPINITISKTGTQVHMLAGAWQPSTVC